MENYLHRVLGLYPSRSSAEAARDKLVQQGMRLAKLKVLEPGRDQLNREAVADSDDVLYEMLREGAIGTVLGALAGVLVTAALVLAKASLFASAPVLGLAIMVGWGASVGGFVGAAAGARSNKGDVSDLLRISLAGGHVVLVAHTATEEQTALARLIIGETMRGPNGVTSS